MTQLIDSSESTNKSRLGANRLGILAVVVVLGLGAAFGYRYYKEYRNYERTDDAFLAATVVEINPQIAGRVLSVCVSDNEVVHKGDLLVEIDSDQLEAELARVHASADLARARKATAELNVSLTEGTTTADVEKFEAEVGAAEAALREARANVTAAESDASLTAKDAERYENLLRGQAVSQQQRDSVVSANEIAQARLIETRMRLAASESQLSAAKAQLARAKTGPQQVAVARSQVATFEAEIDQAEADAKRIEIDLSHTKIYAPEDGTVTNKSVEEGEYVLVGQHLMEVVQNDLYVEANFKETQLTDMRPGQDVKIRIDALRAVTFSGHVHSIQSGTGAAFSLLPPQNATGNYVKVVQRVPVKIVFDEELPLDYPLVVGMSVVPMVRVRP